MSAFVEISTVTPVYGGEAHLVELIEALDIVRTSWETDRTPLRLIESVFVIDGAVDDSERVIRELARSRDWIRIVVLSRNFGQHAATMAGISYTCGDWVVTLDEDMQHHPRDIRELLRCAVCNHIDIVYAKPKAAVHQNFMKDVVSRFYKRSMVRITKNRFVPLFNSYRLMRGSIARAAASVSSADTYFDVLLGWFTERVDAVPLDLKDKRFIESGQSGYTLAKMMNHARRMILTSETNVLRIGGFLGLFSIFSYFGLFVIALAEKFVHGNAVLRGWPSFFILSSFVGGVTLFLLSIAMEYLTVIRVHTQGKPTFFVVDRDSDARIARYFEESENDART